MLEAVTVLIIVKVLDKIFNFSSDRTQQDWQ